jgi:hypothetical protein
MINFILFKLEEIKTNHEPTNLIISTIDYCIFRCRDKNSYEFLDILISDSNVYSKYCGKELNYNFCENFVKCFKLPNIKMYWGQYEIVDVGFDETRSSLRLDFIWDDGEIYSNYVSLISKKLKQIKFHVNDKIIFLRSKKLI